MATAFEVSDQSERENPPFIAHAQFAYKTQQAYQ